MSRERIGGVREELVAISLSQHTSPLFLLFADGLAALVIANLTALACVPRSSRPLVRNGLFGFSSFLVGVALPMFRELRGDESRAE